MIFHLSGYDNKQNFRYWRGNNRRTLHKNPLHSEQVTVWCAMSFQGVVYPVFFFKSENGNMVAVNSERYADMLVNFALPDLDEFVNEETWFQQDGATIYTTNILMDLLKFPGRLICRNGDIFGLPVHQTLRLQTFFHWGCLKFKVFEGNPPKNKGWTLQEINNIPLDMLHRVMETFTRRLWKCVGNKGRHLTDIIF